MYIRAKAHKQEAAAAAMLVAAATAAAGEHDDNGIGDPVKDRRRKISNFARYLGIDPHKDGSLMWIAGEVKVMCDV
jgi:hypothetical protein